MQNVIQHHAFNRMVNEGTRKIEVGPHPEMLDNHVTKGEKGQDEHPEDQVEELGNPQNKIGNIIPPEVFNAYPTVSKLKYQKLSKNHNFLQKQLPVCEDCFLYLTSLNVAAGSHECDKLMLLDDDIKLKGTGKLKPEALRLRHEDTLGRVKDNHIEVYHRMLLLAEVIEEEMKIQHWKEKKEMLFKKKTYKPLKNEESKRSLITRYDTEKNEEYQKTQLKTLVTKNRNLTHILKELTEKNSEMKKMHSPPAFFTLIPRGSSQKKPRVQLHSNSEEQNKGSTSPTHRKVNSMSISNKVRMLTTKPIPIEEVSTQPTHRSIFRLGHSKSKSSKFQSFSKGVTNHQMVGFESSERSSITREHSTPSTRTSWIKSKALATSSDQLFLMYSKKKDCIN